MAGMSVGGLVSGLDTNSIIAQLTALEQSKVNREIAKKDNASKTLEKFKELQNRLGNLSSKAASLATPGAFNLFKSNSNYDDYASISGREGATAGQYELVVKQLATTQKVASNKISAVNTALVSGESNIPGLSNIDAIFGKSESVTIKLSKSAAAIKADPTKKEVEITISKSDTLKDIVNKINAAEGTGVKASIMTMGDGDNRLVLTAVDTGSKGFSVSDESDANGTKSILQYLGILSDANGQVAASGNALVDENGKVATAKSTFDQFNTAFNKIEDGDVVGIFLPTNNGSGDSGWVTFNLFENGTAREIGAVLEEINAALESVGAGAIKADINEAGEIVLKGALNADQNFGDLSKIKLQIGTLKDPNAASVEDPVTGMRIYDGKDSIFSDVKKDLGGFSSRNMFANVITAGENAIYTIDGMAISSQSNNDDKTISGTVFTLKKVSKEGMEPIKVSLEPDMDGLATRINEFIEEYNALIKFIDEHSKASVKEEEDKITGKKVSKREVGVFSGDSNISALRENLRKMVTGTIDEITGVLNNGYSTNYSSAARIGITTQKDGSMGVDRATLVKALNSDFEGVRKLFTANSFSDSPGLKIGNYNKYSTTGVYEVSKEDGEDGVFYKVNGKTAEEGGFTYNAAYNMLTLSNGLSIELTGNNATGKVTFVRGIASMITTFVENARNTVSGYFKESEKTYQARIDSIQKRVDELQTRVDNYNARITKQFAALERNMGNLQSQTANMMSALSTMTTRR